MAPIVPLRHIFFPVFFVRPFDSVTSRTTSRLFSSTSERRAVKEQNEDHYETLQVPYDASPGQIKKQFYTLSKLHHPDLHPDDADAPNRFHRLNDAYHVLSQADKRSTYDRNIGLHKLRHHAKHAAPSGSYSSASSASSSSPGGRTPSGLSKRRSPFRGPPPSFYAQGAWGAHGEKRAKGAAAGHASTADTASARDAAGEAQQDEHGAPTDESGRTQDGDASHEHGFTHWNRRAHFRAHSNLGSRFEAKRRERARERVEAEEGVRVANARDAVVRFLLVGGILGVIVGSPFIWVSLAGGQARGNGKGRKRTAGKGEG